jgi:Beta-ketoacyl synthase, N-terminal domain
MTGMGGLRVVARADWPAGDGTGLPPVAGFTSPFSLLAASVADSCLGQCADRGTFRAGRTAVVLASVHGDISTALAVAGAIEAGTRVSPVLFFQSVPNAVAGHIAARWGLTGPVTCFCPIGEPITEALLVAEILLVDQQADDALVLAVAERAGGGPHAATGLLVMLSQKQASGAGEAGPLVREVRTR